jgi:uncharacterized protein (TIGR03435 family)
MLQNTGAVLLLLCSVPAFCQTESKAPAFEVAEVKVNKSGGESGAEFLPGGQLRVTNTPMKRLITEAWHVRPDAISGGPGWLDSDRFDVIAKATPTSSEDDLRLMLQSLLAERFKLAVHKEEKVTAVYALSVGKTGFKGKVAEPAKPGEARCGQGVGPPEQMHRVCPHITMAELAETLPIMAPRYVNVPVVDQTGLKGSYELKLDWTPMAAPDGTREGDAPTIETAGGFTVFDAVAKLGLKLEKAKLPVPIIVVDRIERIPTEN